MITLNTDEDAGKWLELAESLLFEVVDSDDFMDMPHSAQALYFHLLLRVDGGGRLNNVKSMMRAGCFKQEDLELLFNKGFISQENDTYRVYWMPDYPKPTIESAKRSY